MFSMPLKGLAPMFAGTVMAATGCTYPDAIAALRSVEGDYGASTGEPTFKVDYEGMVGAAIESLKVDA